VSRCRGARPADIPLPFDRAYRQKAAFFGIRDALLGF